MQLYVIAILNKKTCSTRTHYFYCDTYQAKQPMKTWIQNESENTSLSKGGKHFIIEKNDNLIWDCKICEIDEVVSSGRASFRNLDVRLYNWTQFFSSYCWIAFCNSLKDVKSLSLKALSIMSLYMFSYYYNTSILQMYYLFLFLQQFSANLILTTNDITVSIQWGNEFLFKIAMLWVVVCQLLVLYVSDIVLPVCHSISCSIISILFVYSNFFLFSVALWMFLSF
jgi:hypothetical protein